MKTILSVIIGAVVISQSTQAQVIFTDNFNSGASPQWSNQRGNWTAAGGVYNAQAPSNNPLTYSALPFALTDFAVDVDINDVGDGGLWLRSDAAGQNAVVLVTGGQGWGAGVPSGGRTLYWTLVQSGFASGTFNSVNAFTQPGVEDVHVRVTVVGNTYSAYLNGAGVPATTFVNNLVPFPSGQVGLYDFSSQTFDNFTLSQVPEPGTLSLAGLAVVILAGRRLGQRR